MHHQQIGGEMSSDSGSSKPNSAGFRAFLHFPPPSRAELNLERMKGSNLLWDTPGEAKAQAAVAVCPALDDFLVWLDLETEPAFAVPATAEARSAFRVEVLPAIRRYKQIEHRLLRSVETRRIEWALNLTDRAMEGTFAPGDTPPLPAPIIEGLDKLNQVCDDVVAALIAFVERFDAKYEE